MCCSYHSRFFFSVFGSDSHELLGLSNQRWGVFALSQMSEMLPLRNEHLINQNKRLKLKLTHHKPSWSVSNINVSLINVILQEMNKNQLIIVSC